MPKNNLGGKRAIKPSISQGSLNQYFKGIRNPEAQKNLSNTAFKYGNKDIITDSYSMYFLNKTGLKYGKNESLSNMAKDIEKQINDASGFKDINSYITDNKYYNVDSTDRFTQGYGFDTSRVKRARIILGKDAQATIVYNNIGQPMMAIKNKKGEKGWILPVRSI